MTASRTTVIRGRSTGRSSSPLPDRAVGQPGADRAAGSMRESLVRFSGWPVQDSRAKKDSPQVYLPIP